MKKLILIACTLIASITLAAQDIIVTKDAKKIEAKITEVTTSEIRYKELDNLNGPIFILRTDEINCIIYANGKVVLYNQQDLAKQREDEELRRKQEEAARAKVEAEERAKKAQDLIGSFNFAEEPSAAPPCGKQAGPAKGGCGSWQLDGRDLVGRLPQPANTFDQAGRVVVQIRVNTTGNVIAAVVADGTNIADIKTQQLAIDAAMKAKFTSAKHESVGTITYIFKVK